MESRSTSVVTAALLVGLMVLPAASENLAGKESSYIEAESNDPVETTTRISSDSFVKSVSTAFEEFEFNSSGSNSEASLETPDSRIETEKSPGKTVRELETNRGVLRKVDGSEKQVTEVNVAEGTLIEKVENGERYKEFDGFNESHVESVRADLEARFEEELSKMEDYQDDVIPDDFGTNNDSVSLSVYVQPDTSKEDGEYIEINNTEQKNLDISGWSVEDSNGVEYVFDEGSSIPGEESIRVYTDNSEAEFNWDRGLAVWSSSGDTAYIYDESGNQVEQYIY